MQMLSAAYEFVHGWAVVGKLGYGAEEALGHTNNSC